MDWKDLVRLIGTILGPVARWFMRHGTWNTYISDVPLGHRLGGHDEPQLPDKYRILELMVVGICIFRGYWQNQ